MTVPALHALAPTFRHTHAGSYDLSILASDSSTGIAVPVTLPTGDYRMCLAPTTGSVTDVLRALVSAANSALIASASTAVRLTISLSATGVVTLAFTGPVSSLLVAAPLWRILGLGGDTFVEDPDPFTTVAGVRPVFFLGLLTAVTGARWKPTLPGGAERTASGRVYTFASTPASYVREFAVGFQPSTPAQQAESAAEATPFYPDAAYMHELGDTTTARAWSVLDVLWSARNAECSFAMGNWPALAGGSTSEAYWLAWVMPETLMQPETTPLREEWASWEKWTLRLSYPSTGVTGTRA